MQTFLERRAGDEFRRRLTWAVVGLGILALLFAGAWLATARLTAKAHAAAASGPKGYVGLFKDNAVAVVDLGGQQVVGTIPVPPGPHGVAITPDGRKVYVSSDGASTVSVIDTETDRVVGSIEVGPTPHGLALTPDGRGVLVAGFGSNAAELIDTATDQVVGRASVPQPHNSAISPDGRVAYVGAQQQGATALVAIDLGSMTQIATVPLDKAPRALNFSPDGRQLYFTLAGSDAVQVLDPAGNQVVAQIPVGASPHHPLFTPDGDLGLVVSQGPGELDILNPLGNTLSEKVKVGSQPHWIAVSGDGTLAYVTNEGSGDLSVVDLASRTVRATIPVGNGPRKIAVQPGSVGHGADGQPVNSASGASEGATVTIDGATFSDHGSRDVTGQAELELEADDYYFEPTFVRGAPGQTIRLEVDNESGTLHNLSIPSQRIDADLAPHGKAEVEVTIPQDGTVRFFCKFHEALGMNGALLAGDAPPPAVSSPLPPSTAEVVGR